MSELCAQSRQSKEGELQTAEKKECVCLSVQSAEERIPKNCSEDNEAQEYEP